MSFVDSAPPPRSNQQATAGTETKVKHLKFKHYDPLSFVIVILNFLREDTAPLLAPSFDRSVDHPSPAHKAVRESVPGEWKAGGNTNDSEASVSGPKLEYLSAVTRTKMYAELGEPAPERARGPENCASRVCVCVYIEGSSEEPNVRRIYYICLLFRSTSFTQQ